MRLSEKSLSDVSSVGFSGTTRQKQAPFAPFQQLVRLLVWEYGEFSDSLYETVRKLVGAPLSARVRWHQWRRNGALRPLLPSLGSPQRSFSGIFRQSPTAYIIMIE